MFRRQVLSNKVAPPLNSRVDEIKLNSMSGTLVATQRRLNGNVIANIYGNACYPKY